jgi:hypothetical protein
VRQEWSSGLEPSAACCCTEASGQALWVMRWESRLWACSSGCTAHRAPAVARRIRTERCDTFDLMESLRCLTDARST